MLTKNQIEALDFFQKHTSADNPICLQEFLSKTSFDKESLRALSSKGFLKTWNDTITIGKSNQRSIVYYISDKGIVELERLAEYESNKNFGRTTSIIALAISFVALFIAVLSLLLQLLK